MKSNTKIALIIGVVAVLCWVGGYVMGYFEGEKKKPKVIFVPQPSQVPAQAFWQFIFNRKTRLTETLGD
jgi:hypothetical protein